LTRKIRGILDFSNGGVYIESMVVFCVGNREEEVFELQVNDVKKTIGQVRHTISKYNMITPGDLVVIAVSGGPDSVCLLDILFKLMEELGIGIVVAHFNHGLRPDQDEYETRFVERMAMSLNVPFESKRADQSMFTEKGSLEERARNARFQFLWQVKRKVSAQKIAIGHNLNDQAETVLMRLLRGSGPSGLAGIPPNRDDEIVRPLIEVARSEIESYLSHGGLSYVTDASNLRASYLRNRIRLELLPELRKYQPRIVELLGQTAEIMRSEEKLLVSTARTWIEEQSETDGSKIFIPLTAFARLPGALKNHVIRVVLRMSAGNLRRINLRHIAAINHIAMGDRPQSKVDLPNDLVVRRVYDRLVFSKMENTQITNFFHFIEGPGTHELENLRYTVSIKELENRELPDMKGSPWTAFVDADLIKYPLVIRNFRKGDRFIPFGMRGHRKLKDFFMDLKIPSEERARIPIMAYKDTIIWVCGLRLDDRFKVKPDTRKVLKVTFDEDISKL
jgi:tRNA(Ile)-lysidine synthase